MCRRLRWQASSHRVLGCMQIPGPTQTPCRSRACSRWRWVRPRYVECAAAFAGQPAPTGASGACKYRDRHKLPVGARLAREDGVSGKGMLDVPPPSLASQLPQAPLVHADTVNDENPCGRWPASDGAGAGTAVLNVAGYSLALHCPTRGRWLRCSSSGVAAGWSTKSNASSANWRPSRPWALDASASFTRRATPTSPSRVA